MFRIEIFEAVEGENSIILKRIMDDFKRQLSNSFGLMPELQATNKSEDVNIFDNKFKNRKKIIKTI